MPRKYLFAVLLGVASATMPVVAHAKPADVALVLAIDVSGSVNEERFQLQRAGYAKAFASPALIAAIRASEHHAIAVALVQWSSDTMQKTLIDWTLISDAESAGAFSSTIAEKPRVFDRMTSISGGIDYSADLLKLCPFEATHQVIDVSGDGSNNDGRPVEQARDDAVAAGITINGLPILTEEPRLDDYYRDHVVGGPGAFVVPAKDFDAFADAIARKLILEIASRHGAPRLRLAAVAVP